MTLEPAGIVRQSGGMTEQLVDRDPGLVGAHALEMIRQRVVERELSPVRQDQDGRRGELLGQGADVEQGIGVKASTKRPKTSSDG